jgi:probable HAF family extracellular repeat protein
MISKRLRIIALVLFVAPTVPVQLAAQNKAKQDQPHQPHHYQIVDLGSTFGGPQSYFAPGSGDQFSGTSVLNSWGTVVGFADTSAPDPFPNFCWSDCFVADTFQAGSSGVLTNLGALPGGGSSAPIWITANGLIAGTSENGQTDPLYPGGFPENHAVLWQQGQIMDLGTLPEGGYQSEANAVNSAGQVVGSALNTIPDANSMAAGNFWYFDVPYGYQQRAFLWDKEKGMQDLGTLPGGTDAQALLINERGQVVGFSYTSSAPGACGGGFALTTGAFIWDKNDGMRDLGSFGGTCTVATNLNNEGQIVGSSNLTGDQSSVAFLWENGSIHKLRGSLGGHFTGAFGLNDQGQAVGFGNLPGDNTFHATLWKSLQSMTDLGVVGADSCSYAAAINAKMQVVGASTPACDDFDDVARAFLWENGSLFDLNSLVPPASTLYLQLTYAINDRGEIAGTGVDASGNEHAFLLIPCDQNHPGVDGCDYSLVDATAATQNPARRHAPSETQRPPQQRRSGRYRVSGVARAMIGTAIEGTDPRPSASTTGNRVTEDFLASDYPMVSLSGEVVHKCTPRGHPCEGVPCCPGLVCKFSGGSTRAGYACEP